MKSFFEPLHQATFDCITLHNGNNNNNNNNNYDLTDNDDAEKCFISDDVADVSELLRVADGDVFTHPQDFTSLINNINSDNDDNTDNNNNNNNNNNRSSLTNVTTDDCQLVLDKVYNYNDENVNDNNTTSYDLNSSSISSNNSSNTTHSGFCSDSAKNDNIDLVDSKNNGDRKDDKNSVQLNSMVNKSNKIKPNILNKHKSTNKNNNNGNKALASKTVLLRNQLLKNGDGSSTQTGGNNRNTKNTGVVYNISKSI